VFPRRPPFVRLLALDARAITHADVEQAVTLGETDVFRGAQRLAGIAARDEYAAEFWTRGGRWDQTRVLVDGLPLFAPTHAFGAYSALNPDALGSAVLHLGVRPASIAEGGSGVVDVRTRHGAGRGSLEWLPARRSTRMAYSGIGRGTKGRGTSRISAAVAATVLVAMIVVAAGPARAWIVGGVRAFLDETSSDARAVPVTSRSVTSSTVAVTFAPEADEVLFWLAARPAGGTLELLVADGGRTTAEIARGQASEEIVVVPNGVRIRNMATSVADYRVTVGRSGMRLRLRVGSSAAARDTVFTAASQSTRIDLRAIRSP
jgi:hypothetical protein